MEEVIDTQRIEIDTSDKPENPEDILHDLFRDDVGSKKRTAILRIMFLGYTFFLRKSSKEVDEVYNFISEASEQKLESIEGFFTTYGKSI